jgi:hypothetical protein
VLTGTFVDSAVANIGFRTETRQGVTGPNGEFTYLAGEHVTFFIGDLRFPTALAAPVVTPLTLAGTQDVTDRRVTNMAILLISLDADGDPRNGIAIPAAAAAIARSVEFDQPPAEFRAAAAVTSLVAGSGSVTTIPVAPSAATDHLSRSVGIVGTWTTSGAENDLLALFADGTFVYAETDGEAPNGVEAGTYTWDATAQEITFDVQFETNASGISEGAAPGPHRYSAVLTDGGLTLAGFVKYTRQPLGAGVAGTWRGQLVDPATSSLPNRDVLCLLPDGRFFFVEEWGTPGNGVEAGTYAYDAATETITFQRTFDDNLNGGIFDGGATASAPLVLAGDDATFAGLFRLVREGGRSRTIAASDAFAGTWITPGPELSVLVTFADGFFVYAETAGEAPNGLEAGTYTYDAGTRSGTFNVTFQHATTGGIGVGAPPFDLLVDGDVLWLRDPDSGRWLMLVRQPVGAGLAGTWTGPDPLDVSPAPDPHAEVLVILADGRWLLAEPAGVLPNGLEAGTWSAGATQITVARTFTDGTEGGFGPGGVADFLLAGNELQLRHEGAAQDAPWLTLTRR